MAKIKLEFKLPKNKQIEYNGAIIEVTPFLTLSQQLFLTNRYVKEYFFPEDENMIEESEYNYLGAEYALMNYIFQVVTNIDAENMDSDIYADFTLWQKIISEITNYNDFRNKLYLIVMEIKEQKVLNNSIGEVLSNLINKAYQTLDKFKDISPEEVNKLKNEGLELLSKLEKSSVLGNNITGNKTK